MDKKRALCQTAIMLVMAILSLATTVIIHMEDGSIHAMSFSLETDVACALPTAHKV